MKNIQSSVLYMLFAYFSLSLLLTSCDPIEKDQEPSSAFVPYISAYSGGVHSITDPIVIELANTFSEITPNTIIDKELFTISPSVKGKAVWKDAKTIYFTPNEALKSNTKYTVNFHLGELFNVDSALKTFTYTFRTKIASGSLKLKDYFQLASNANRATLVYSLELSDNLNMAGLEKAIKVTDQASKDLEFVVNTIKNTEYEIEIEGINRTSSKNEVKIEINGSDVGLQESVTHSFEIPEKGDFRVLQSERLRADEKGIKLTFSEALDPNQDIDSYVSLTVGGERVPFLSLLNANQLTVFVDNDKVKNTDVVDVQVYNNVKSAYSQSLQEEYLASIRLGELCPDVQFMATGTILPNSEQQYVSFQATGLRYVDLQVVQIYGSNVLSFLQTQDISDSDNLKRSGRLVLKKRLDLREFTSSASLEDTNRFDLDLSSLFEKEKGAIYHLALSFLPEYTLIPKFATTNLQSNTIELAETIVDDSKWDSTSYYDYTSLQLSMPYNWNDYDWTLRDDPSELSFYMEESNVSSTTNVYATNIGLIAKQNDTGKLWIAANNILTSAPMSNVDIKVYSYQLQVIAKGQTNKNGFVEIDNTTSAKPYLIVADYDQDRTILKVKNGEQLSSSRFEVGGVVRANGLKGYIYGERGVWRPGDSIHLCFVLEDKDKKLPANHPVSLELYNPNGQFYTKLLSSQQENGVYYFKIDTQEGDPTGVWNAYIKIGGSSFHQSLRIETIKPNRLKIHLNFKNKLLHAGETEYVNLSANWLMGAKGSNLVAQIDMSVSPFRSAFAQYDDYLFTELSKDLRYSTNEIYKGTLDADGQAQVGIPIPAAENAPGMLKANFTARVYEPGGDFSIYAQESKLSPYKSYVGMKLLTNKASEDSDYLETDQPYTISVVSVDENGKVLPNKSLSYEIYKIDWSWWYQKENLLANYVHNKSISPVYQGSVASNQSGKATFNVQVNYPDYGRYLVYVKDPASGHAVSQVYYIDWPSWRGRSGREDARSATVLPLTLDKKEYEVGETVELTIPSSAENARALVSIESGSQVLDYKWIDLKASEDTKYTFKATENMTPNVYAFVTLLQPHSQTVNDSPIRMYGVVPVIVNNKEALLEPVIDFPQTIAPEKSYTLSIKEKKGKAMTYTIAIVDDGLLDLTSFKTPNPYSYFYSKEALGINTWDMYDDVIGARNYVFNQMYRVGGDEMLKPGEAKAKRFKPVVLFYGPYTVAANKTATHEIKLPMYVGSVRVMVVASNGSAFGAGEHTTQVKNPLMLISSLPRVLSVDEEIEIPVNVFAMSKDVKQVNVQMKVSDNIQLVDGSTKTLQFTEEGDKVVYFRAKVGSKVGIEKVSLTATSSGHNATEDIEIDVRNPNPVLTLTEEQLVNASSKVSIPYDFSDVATINPLIMEVSRIPSISLGSRMDYLNRYSHHTTEGYISRAFSLLYMDKLTELNKEQQAENRQMIENLIQKVYGRQIGNGGFSNWPNYNYTDHWLTAYAALFLVKAKEQGFKVNANVLDQTLNALSKKARIWTTSDASYLYTSYMHAFNLYVLAVANRPEMAAMNRLLDVTNMSNNTRWVLALAYASAGKKDTGSKLIFQKPADVESEADYYYYYGSPIRDAAFGLLTYVGLGQSENAFKQARSLAQLVNKETQYQTQSTSFALFALAEYVGNIKEDGMKFDYAINDQKEEVKTIQTFFRKEWTSGKSRGTLQMNNQSKDPLYVQLSRTVQLTKDTVPAIQDRGILLNVQYLGLSGQPISIDKVKQGTDVMARVAIKNTLPATDLNDIALTHILPSGWEVYQVDRLSDSGEGSTQSSALSYQDIRDDRVLSYLSLRPGQTAVVTVRLHATYLGKFTLPAIIAEAMYLPEYRAKTDSGVVTVVR